MANRYHNLMLTVADHCSAWISPEGKFHAVPECGHERYARAEIFQLDEKADEFAFWQHPGGIKLEREGWLHVSYGSIRHEVNPTQRQIDTLFDFACVAMSEKGWYARNLQATALAFIAAS